MGVVASTNNKIFVPFYMTTLIVPEDFSPAEDAEDIKKACVGFGTDEKTIISILGHRNSFQKRLIREAYQQIYQEDLINQLKSELSGNLEKTLCLWTMDSADRDATLANMALQTTPTLDYKTIIEISCIRSPQHLLLIKQSYLALYKHSLEEDVASATSGDIRKLLVSMASCYRHDGEEIDEGLSVSEANILHDKIKQNSYNDEEVIRILTTRSKAQLNATFDKYRSIYSVPIRKELMSDPTNEYLVILRTTIRCIHNPKRHFVKVLQNATASQITDEDSLSRVIVTRAETDLKYIKEMYLKKSKISLDHVLTGDKLGRDYYKLLLLALLGNYEN